MGNGQELNLGACRCWERILILEHWWDAGTIWPTVFFKDRFLLGKIREDMTADDMSQFDE